MNRDFFRHGTGLWMRKDSRDEQIIKERAQYLALQPTRADVLLDLGANIGAVSAAFLEAGAAKVVALEPEPGNFELLVRNLAPYRSRALAINMAVAARSEVRTLWISDSLNFGLHSLIQHRGRRGISVPAVALAPLVQLVEPTLVKIDIEGGEYELASVLNALPMRIRGVAMELHLGRKEWRVRAAHDLINVLSAQGFHEQGKLRITTSNRGSLGIWLR